MPTTLAPSSTLRSSALSRSICFSISCLTFSGTPDSMSATASPSVHDPSGSRVWNDDALVDQVLHHVDHEQRVAFGAAVNQPRQPPRQLVAGTPARQILVDRFLRQVLERQLVTEAVRLQLPLDAFQRVLSEDHVHRPVGADHHQPRRIAAARQIGDQVERRVVAPVQIFEHENQRRLRPPSPRSRRPSRAASARGWRPTARCCSVSRSAAGTSDGSSEQPRRRVLAQQGRDPLAARRPAEPRKAVEHRQVRFACAVLLETLPARRPDPLSAVGPVREGR